MISKGYQVKCSRGHRTCIHVQFYKERISKHIPTQRCVKVYKRSEEAASRNMKYARQSWQKFETRLMSRQEER